MRQFAAKLIFGGKTMRKVMEPQMTIGEVSIPDIEFD